MVINILENISVLIWTITTFFILYVGIYFTVKLKIPQLRIFKILKSLKDKNKETYKLLNLTLAGKIGVGSISGIAICIITGGISSIFWLWVSAFILASLTYVETKLGIQYKTKSNIIGGPSKYIEKITNNKMLSIIYSFLIIITYVIAFTSIQTNTIVISLENNFNIDKLVVVISLIIIFYLSTKNGISTISKITSILTPIMGMIYIIIGIIIIFNNYDEVINILKLIIINALNIKNLKSVFLIPFIVGIQRGIFSNESGIGTTAIVISDSNSEDFQKQANIQMLGTYFTSLIICTITAIIILTSNYEIIETTNINGIEIVSYAFLEHFGYYGIILLTAIIFMFAFSTIVTSYYYGEINYKYLFDSKKSNLKIVTILVIIYSAFTKPNLLWNIVDILVAILSIINTYAMLKIIKKE